jgi:hypothetical protein
VGDSRVELLLLHRVEAELVLGVGDELPDHYVVSAAAMAVMAVGLSKRDSGAKCRCDGDSGNSRDRAESAVERHIVSFR